MATNINNLIESIIGFGQRITDRFDQYNNTISSNSDRIDLMERRGAGVDVGMYVSTPDELDLTQNTPVDQSVIFHTWHRFSHNSSENQPAIPNELLDWDYDTATETINNTSNSSSFIGVISLERYDKYILDVKLSSANTDDDTIGVVFAWATDPTTGREYSLSVTRSPGGNSPLYGVVMNRNRSDQWVLHDGNSLVTWGNNAAGSLNATDAGYNSNSPGWGGMAAFQETDGSVNLLIERNEDIITIKTSQWNDPDVIDESTLITIDLNSDPRLTRFKGPRPYGFCSFSQASSKWVINNFTNPHDSIYDLSTGLVYVYVSNQWEVDPNGSLDVLAGNRFLYNSITKKMFYYENSSNIQRIATEPL